MYIERERERACLQGAPGAGDGREDNAAVALEAVRGKSEGVAVLGHRRQHHLLRGQEGRRAHAHNSMSKQRSVSLHQRANLALEL